MNKYFIYLHKHFLFFYPYYWGTDSHQNVHILSHSQAHYRLRGTPHFEAHASISQNKKKETHPCFDRASFTSQFSLDVRSEGTRLSRTLVGYNTWSCSWTDDWPSGGLERRMNRKKVNPKGGREPHRCDPQGKQSPGSIVPTGDGGQHGTGKVSYLVVLH